LHQQRLQDKERRHKELADENAALQERLSQVHGRESKCLGVDIERKRKELEENRRLGAEHRRRELMTQNELLKDRLEHVHSPERLIGGDEKKEKEWRQQKIALTEKQKAFEDSRQAEKSRQQDDRRQHRQELSNLLSGVSQGRDVKCLDHPIEERRRELKAQRRLRAERRKAELKAHKTALKHRILSARGRDQKSLDQQTKSKRRELGEKRLQEKYRQKQELKQHNASFRKRISRFLTSAEYYGSDPEASARRTKLEQEKRRFEEIRQQEAAQKKQEITVHKKEFRERNMNVKKGRDCCKVLDEETESARRALAEKRRADAQRRNKELTEMDDEFRIRLLNATGRDVKSLDDEIEGARSGRKHFAVLRRNKDTQSWPNKMQNCKVG
jgi:hypothetical protein